MVGEAAVSAGLPLLLQTIYLKLRLRTLEVADAGQWKSVVYAVGGYWFVARMEMGETAAKKNGKKLRSYLTLFSASGIGRVLEL